MAASSTLLLAFALSTQTFALPEGLINAVCYVESGHSERAWNPDDGGSDSVGACQIKLATARHMGFRGSIDSLAVPSTNVHYAAKYLRYQLDYYAGDLRKAIAAYNAGKWRTDNDGMTKNRQYVGKVFKAWKDNR